MVFTGFYLNRKIMKTKLSLLVLLLAFSVTNVFSHALWIETTANGKKGQAQEVKIFFGEYEANEPDSAAKWFSNLKQFKLVLTAPNGATKVLTASPDVHFFKASFTPDQNGTYKLSVVHEVADIYEKGKLLYYAFADVAVGGSKVNTAFPADAALTIRPGKYVQKAGESATYQVIYNKTPLAKQKLTVVNAERKVVPTETDADGKFTFKPEQKGNYFLEAFTEEKASGKLNGKDYEKVWHLVTYTTQVN
ncbi:putative GH25 family protein [Pedobacter agri]|nr:putative GH25 family protein [Pedobacter agri]